MSQIDILMEAGVVHYLDRLGEPFLFLEERIVTVTTAGVRPFTNTLPKVLFVIEGTICHRFDEGRTERLQAGDGLVNLGAFRQTYLPLSPPRASRIRVLRLTFAPGFPDGSGTTDDFVRQVLRRLPAKGILSDGPADWIAEMRRELKHPRRDCRPRINALARVALIDLARSSGRQGSRDFSDARAGERLCDMISQYLEKHLGEPLTLSDIARAVDRSEEHIARTFRKHHRRTIFAELLRLRTERARYLLLCSDLNMTAIAGQCGFASPAHFSRTFRQQTGMSPTECAAQFR